MWHLAWDGNFLRSMLDMNCLPKWKLCVCTSKGKKEFIKWNEKRRIHTRHHDIIIIFSITTIHKSDSRCRKTWNNVNCKLNYELCYPTIHTIVPKMVTHYFIMNFSKISFYCIPFRAWHGLLWSGLVWSIPSCLHLHGKSEKGTSAEKRKMLNSNKRNFIQFQNCE